jgi:hypothetical protein
VRHWPYWLKGNHAELPKPWPEGSRETAADGSELALAVRLHDLDPLEQVLTLDMRAQRWVEGELVAEEQHALTITLYFRDELLAMLDRAGFGDVEVFAGNSKRPPTRDDDFLVFVARR